MLYAGVAWDADGYTVEVLADDGRSGPPPRRFGRGEVAGIVGFLRALEAPSVAVVDSTNGLLDGHMTAAGLEVYRADPPVLPARPLLGSAPAGELARAALRDLSRVTQVLAEKGTLTGRGPDVGDVTEAGAPALEALIAAGRCLEAGPRDAPLVALTFDDGPNPPHTGRILDTLARYGVPATFFCTGLNAAGYPDEVARAAEQGHLLANHTWSHPLLQELTRAQLVEQVERTGEVLAGIPGGAAPTLFRPPYGAYSADVLGWLGELGTTVALWDVDPEDWSRPGAEAIAQSVLDQARPGSIVLMHDGGGDRSQTAEALPAIIEGLLARDYRFVRVDALTERPL